MPFSLFSKLSKADRDKLPADAFGDPSRRLFPVVDQEDLDSAARLLGKAKNPEQVRERLIAIAKRKGLKLPEAWTATANHSADDDTSALIAEFAVETAARRVDGDYAVYPNALLFKAGAFPDKQFELSPEEMWAATEQFQPVGGNIQHTGFLAGRACEVRSIRLDDSDPYTLRGEVAVPLWLDENLEGHERKLSCEWGRSTKTLDGIALVVNPRVPEAALISAYAAFERSKTADGSEPPAPVQETFGTEHTSGEGGHGKMAETVFEKFMEFMRGEAPEATTTEPVAQTPSVAQPSVTAAMSTGESDETRRLRERNAKLEDENARIRAESIHRDAVAFARQIIGTEKRANPAEEDAIVRGYVLAASDDLVLQPATFSMGGASVQQSRVDVFKALYAARLPNQVSLSTGELKPEVMQVLMAAQRDTTTGKDEKLDQEGLNKLIKMTPLGASALNGTNGAAH